MEVPFHTFLSLGPQYFMISFHIYEKIYDGFDLHDTISKVCFFPIFSLVSQFLFSSYVKKIKASFCSAVFKARFFDMFSSCVCTSCFLYIEIKKNIINALLQPYSIESKFFFNIYFYLIEFCPFHFPCVFKQIIQASFCTQFNKFLPQILSWRVVFSVFLRIFVYHEAQYASISFSLVWFSLLAASESSATLNREHCLFSLMCNS